MSRRLLVASGSTTRDRANATASLCRFLPPQLRLLSGTALACSGLQLHEWPISTVTSQHSDGRGQGAVHRNSYQAVTISDPRVPPMAQPRSAVRSGSQAEIWRSRPPRAGGFALSGRPVLPGVRGRPAVPTVTAYRAAEDRGAKGRSLCGPHG